MKEGELGTKTDWRSPRNWAVFALRLGLGWVFLWSGGRFLYTSLTSGGSITSGFLQFATFGPFAGFFQSLAGNPVVDALFVWGLFLAGLGLVLGALTRVAAAGGATLMLLIYLSAWPPEHNPVVDDHIVYVLAAILLMVLGAGRFLGLDGWLEKRRFVQRHRRLTAVLG